MPQSAALTRALARCKRQHRTKADRMFGKQLNGGWSGYTETEFTIVSGSGTRTLHSTVHLRTLEITHTEVLL
jgi:hypothetical protein